MTLILTRVASFTGRHWLRLLILGGALFLFSQRQIALNVQLGTPAVPVDQPLHPAPAPGPETTAAGPPSLLSENDAPAPAIAAEEPGFFDRFSLFGGGEAPSRYDLLTRTEEETIAAFLRRFSNVAQTEQEKFGIPASIILANALLQSRAGEDDMAGENNNFFALPATADWSGDVAHHRGLRVRAYATAWTSFRDHSLYLTSGHFTPLTRFSETDYRRWAAGMRELGYGKMEDLDGQLLRTIDRYQLFRFD